MFVNDDTYDQSFAGTITTSMTDHYFNFIFLKNKKSIKRPESVTYRAFTEKNISKFIYGKPFAFNSLFKFKVNGNFLTGDAFEIKRKLLHLSFEVDQLQNERIIPQKVPP